MVEQDYGIHRNKRICKINHAMNAALNEPPSKKNAARFAHGSDLLEVLVFEVLGIPKKKRTTLPRTIIVGSGAYAEAPLRLLEVLTTHRLP